MHTYQMLKERVLKRFLRDNQKNLIILLLNADMIDEIHQNANMYAEFVAVKRRNLIEIRNQ